VEPVAGAEHWNERYRTVGTESVSWYEATPAVSLDLLDRSGVSAARSVLDVGGGAATLVDRLLDRGHTDLAVLDLSRVALDDARQRLRDPPAVTWIEADLVRWDPPRLWDVWHDRAVLHFLTSDDERAAYVGVLRRAVRSAGVFVIGTFAEDGPTHCSGLPVRRQSATELVDLLGDVDVVETRRHVHRTPGGTDQAFTWVAGRLR
jgi:SAM-dependent methyltransferase